jgi:hypothetical protein
MDIYPGHDGNRLVAMDQLKSIWVYQWDVTSRTVIELGSISQHVTGKFDAYNVDGIHLDGTTTFVTTTSNVTFVHDMFMNSDGTLAQSAWSQIVMTGSERLRYVDSWGEKIRFFVRSPQGHSFLEYSHRKPIAPTDFAFDPRLDRRELLTGTYIPASDETEFVISGRIADLSNLWVLTTRMPDGTISQDWHRPVWINGKHLRIKGKWTEYEHYVGWDFQYRMVLSKVSVGPTQMYLVFRGSQGFFFVDTTDADVRITRLGQSAHKSIKSSSFTLNDKSLNASQPENLELRLGILGSAKDATIEVFSESPGSCTFSSIEWNVDARGRV